MQGQGHQGVVHSSSSLRPANGNLLRHSPGSRMGVPFQSRQLCRQPLHVCNLFTGIVQGMAEVSSVSSSRDHTFSQLKVTFPGKAGGEHSTYLSQLKVTFPGKAGGEYSTACISLSDLGRG